MKIRPIIIIIPLLILVLALVGGSILIWRLFFFILLVFLLSYLWAFLNLRGIEVQVEKSSEHFKVGEWFDEEVTVLNRSRLPKFKVTIEEVTNLPGQHNNIFSLDLPPRSTHRWQSKFHCQHRGRYKLGSFKITASDPFGFFNIRRNIGNDHSIIVYPATLELPLFQPESYNMPDYGPSSWLQREVAPDVARVREYANGDTLNHIHWHSTAHTGKLMVKVFDAEHLKYSIKNIWLILNMHQAIQSGSGNETTEEYSITIASSLMKKYIDSGKQVGLITSGSQDYLFTPDTGDEHLQKVLEALALIKATGNLPIDELISDKTELFKSDSAIIIISPSADDRITEVARYLEKRDTMVIVILLDSASFGKPVSTASMPKRLISSGVSIYYVKSGQNLARALDSRTSSSSLRFAGERK
jgi:uncharacterized protein (DUF58 family)